MEQERTIIYISLTLQIYQKLFTANRCVINRYSLLVTKTLTNQ